MPLPQIANPPSGYLLSSNQTLFKVTATGDNLRRADYPPEHGFQTRMTNRADRGLDLMAAKGKFSEADFLAIKWDKHYAPQSRAMAYIRRIADMTLRRTVWRLKDKPYWPDGMASPQGSRAALAYVVVEEWKAEQAGKAAPDIAPVYETCLAELKPALAGLTRFGLSATDLSGAKVNIALGGGPDTLRAIYGLPAETGQLKAVAGDGLFMSLGRPKGAKSVHGAYSGAASSRPASAHYADQTQLALMSKCVRS